MDSAAERILKERISKDVETVMVAEAELSKAKTGKWKKEYKHLINEVLKANEEIVKKKKVRRELVSKSFEFDNDEDPENHSERVAKIIPSWASTSVWETYLFPPE